MKKMNKKGFTLIEMLVVIAIIAVLVSIVVPTVSTATMKSKGAADAANLRTITAEAAIEYLEQNYIDTEYKLDSKVAGSELAVTFYTNDANGDLVAVVTVNKATVSVEFFSDIAETGKTEGAKGIDVTKDYTKVLDKAPNT